MLGLFILSALDIIWLLSVGDAWMIGMPQNKLWTKMRITHLVIFGLSLINFLLKVNIEKLDDLMMLDNRWWISSLYKKTS